MNSILTYKIKYDDRSDTVFSAAKWWKPSYWNMAQWNLGRIWIWNTLYLFGMVHSTISIVCTKLESSTGSLAGRAAGTRKNWKSLNLARNHFNLLTQHLCHPRTVLWPISCWFKCQKVVKTIILQWVLKINTNWKILERRVFFGSHWCFIYLEWLIASLALSVPSKKVLRAP